MTIKPRIEKLERKLRLKQPIRHAPSLFNPSKEEIERAHREYPGAILYILDIEPPPKEACGIAEWPHPVIVLSNSNAKPASTGLGENVIQSRQRRHPMGEQSIQYRAVIS
jgi:hypothetical protein